MATRTDNGFDLPSKSNWDASWTLQSAPYRSISKKTVDKYKTKVFCDQEGVPRGVRYFYPGNLKKDKLLDKPETGARYKQTGVNESNKRGLYGWHTCAPNEKYITIVEGEDDAHHMYEWLQGKYPVLSVRSASNAENDVKHDFDKLMKAEKIYLCLDNDEAGKEATDKIVDILGYDKVYFVDLPDEYKDISEMVEDHRGSEIFNMWYNAKRYKPTEIINTYDQIEEALKEDKYELLGNWPWPTLQDMTLGLATSELVVVQANTGAGKTEIMRAIEYHALTDASHKGYPVGAIHIEEDEARSIRGIVGRYLNEVAHNPVMKKYREISNEEIIKEYKKLTGGKEDRFFLYSHFGSKDPSNILNTIRYLVTVQGCKLVILDHIHMMISGLGNKDERILIDQILTELVMMVKELGFCLVAVSHENDDGRARGSRIIEQVAMTYIRASRDMYADTAEERSLTHLRLLKNRNGSVVGPCGTLKFDEATFKFNEVGTDDLALGMDTPF